MRTIPVSLPTPYSALIERGGLARAGALAHQHLPAGGRVVVITTPPVRAHWGAAVEASLAAAGVPYGVLEMADGERHKDLASLGGLADAMVRAGADRETLVIALGGGVVGDVAAFLASVYMRGVALMQIPTTLVAMIDSALGGKTAVNLPTGKNLIGTFHHPQVILVDPEVLSTLPGREYRSGLAEAIKYGIIRDRALFDYIEANAAGLRECAPEALAWVIGEGLRHKAEVVAADEREGDLRRILNFGHTLGHALESATGYERFLHGEAVAWGMIAAGAIAVKLGRFDPDEAERMNRAILAVCAPLPAIVTMPEEIVRHAASDKKARAGVLHFVLPTRIGAVEVVKDVPVGVMVAALEQTIAMARAGRAPAAR